ncbi:putative sulfate transport protein CysZ [Legionella lansingensis]|uniref:Putative sulfate transport protein CysZ n=1 Tax=Legionella lansingensis TaxID=45067 RepID=A0A0W0VT77_9GAMM|nr:sulfate transporter CysZ [Legionella lansingensis]KTD23376.1 putative sulfate transport protein CysZ [Legionella lansingensis]SNV49448.1 putative sulfate transport protein CysZ [Legionella lansingensis]
MRDFFTGIYYFFSGLRSLNKKGLRRFVVMPVIFNLFVYGAIAYLGYHYLSPWADYYISKLPHWLSFLSVVFTILFFLLFILFFLTTFSVLANLFAAPFNGLLAERAQKILQNASIPERGFGKAVIQSIKRQGQFIAYYVPRLLLMCFLFFLPPFHPMLPFLWFVFNAWILSIQYQDFVMDNNLIDFKTMRSMISNNKSLSLGFGFAASLLSFVPFMNLLVMPAAVIGATNMFYLKIYSKIRQNSKNRL